MTSSPPKHASLGMNSVVQESNSKPIRRETPLLSSVIAKCSLLQYTIVTLLQYLFFLDGVLTHKNNSLVSPIALAVVLHIVTGNHSPVPKDIPRKQGERMQKQTEQVSDSNRRLELPGSDATTSAKMSQKT